VRLEVETGLEQGGRFREADRKRRIGGGERPVRERARGAGRALAEAAA